MMPRLSGTSNNGSFLYVDYTLGTPNVPGNYTDVSWTVGVHWGTYYFNIHKASVRMSTTLGSVSGTTGTGTYESGWPISGAGPNRDHAFKSGTTRVTHNAAGNGNIVFNGSAQWDTPDDFTSTLSKTVALTLIPKVPVAPAIPTISGILPTSAIVTWVAPANGGSAITDYDVGYSLTPTSPPVPTTVVSGTSPLTITGLIPGTKYYVWVRAKNAVGNGPYSSAAVFSTLAGAHVNVAGVWKFAVPYVNVGGVWKLAIPWVRDAGVWKETT